jgi:hypothetical protein
VKRGQIDPNVRVHGNQTFNTFEDWDGGEVPAELEHVMVYELEAMVEGEASVAEVDAEKRLVYLNVYWHNLRPYTDPTAL